VIIAIVAIVVLFGAKKIPEMARSLGRAQNEFKKGMREGASETDAAEHSEDTEERPERKAESPD
jgi:sec-independent protein translocase protein TatA